MSSSHVAKIGRKQSLLFPDMIENYIDENNPARLFDSFVDSLDSKEMNFRYAVLEEGPRRPSYDPSDMLKLYLMGYYNGIRSSRNLENECYCNMEVMWLIQKLTPDFKTIADFRKDNIDTVKSLFRKFNLFLKELGLLKSQDIAADGTKIKAVNSMDRSYTRAYLKMEQDRIDERIDKYLHDMNENDAIEEDIDRERSGRPPRLSEDQIRKIDQDIRKSPSDFNYHQNFWDGVVLQRHIMDHYGVSIGVRQCQNLFHKLDFRLRKPVQVIAKADEEKKREFKKN